MMKSQITYDSYSSFSPLYKNFEPCFSKNVHRFSPFYMYIKLCVSMVYFHFCVDLCSLNHGTPFKLTDVAIISNFTNSGLLSFSPWLFKSFYIELF